MDEKVVKMARSKAVILVKKLPKSEEKQSVLKGLVAQIHANAVIRRMSAENWNADQMEQLLDLLTVDTQAQ